MLSEHSVFVNCPFDDDYYDLAHALLFTLIYLGLEPRISETKDSGSVRIDSIVEMIRTSQYSIHDLSRIEPLRDGELPRFNMPFECGIDFGFRKANPAEFGNKRMLILEKEQYRYQKVMSDISGNDISAHGDEPEQLIKSIRDWFRRLRDVPTVGYREIYLAFGEFEYDFESSLVDQGYEVGRLGELTFSDIIESIKNWISVFKSKT